MPSPRQRRGTAAENRAADFLQRKKFEIIGRHITSRFGEIDILARDEQTVVAVEVKYRSTDAMGKAIEGVTAEKLEKIHAALEDYCAREKIKAEKIRIDLVTIDGENIEHIIGVE